MSRPQDDYQVREYGCWFMDQWKTDYAANGIASAQTWGSTELAALKASLSADNYRAREQMVAMCLNTHFEQNPVIRTEAFNNM